MKYLLAIRVTDFETDEVNTEIYEFKNEFDREDACWDIDQLNNSYIEYAVTQEDWVVEEEQICFCG